MKKSDQPLDVNIEDDQLVIRIGIDTLAFAFEESSSNNPYSDHLNDFIRMCTVTDARQFAKDVQYELTREEEDGSSILTNLLDKACDEAANQGSIALDYEDK